MLKYTSVEAQRGASAFFRKSARTLVSVGLTAGLTLSLVACGQPQIATPDTGGAATETTATDDTSSVLSTEDAEAYLSVAKAFSIDASGLFSERDSDASYDAASATKVALSDAGSTVTGTGAAVSGSEVTITAGGTYVLSGSLTDGRIVVDVPDTEKVQIVLSGASVTSSGPCALYVRSADKVFLTLADATSNVLAATGADTDEDGRTLDGTVFAADDLTVNGTGSLTITSATGTGIVAKDELTVCGGTLDVTAAEHAIAAKDSFAASDGTLTLKAQKDGIHVAHDTNGEKGFVYIAGGTFTIEAEDDGIHASNDVQIDGGTLKVAAGDDGIHSEFDLIVNDGTVDITACTEGLEGARVEQNGGSVSVTAKDDGVNAPGDPTVADLTGENSNSSKNEGEPWGDKQGTRPEMGGEMPEGMPENMSEGMPEGMPEDMPEGDFPSEGSDGSAEGGRGFGRRGPRSENFEEDGMPQGFQAPDMGQMPGGGGGFGGFDADESASITVAGGLLVVDAGGDGLDSNGSIDVSGGEVYVSGPTNDGNAALDYGTSATVTGGIVVATGSAGMAENFGGDSTQGSMLVSLAGNAGDTITLTDAAGAVLATHTATKSYACVLVSAPGVSANNTYTVSNGSESKSVTMDSATYSDVSGFMGGGGFGGRGMRGGEQQGTDAGQPVGAPQDRGDMGNKSGMGGDTQPAEGTAPAGDIASA